MTPEDRAEDLFARHEGRTSREAFIRHTADAIRAAVLEERESCAQAALGAGVALKHEPRMGCAADDGAATLEGAAAAIRGRPRP
jgi:hypothetical protein